VQGRTISKEFEVNEAAMAEFLNFLRAQKIPFTEQDLAQGGDWIKAQIKTELFISQFGQQEGLAVRARSDPQILSALKLLPKAQLLLQSGPP
jgi:carboxyl-terminal processing protease